MIYRLITKLVTPWDDIFNDDCCCEKDDDITSLVTSAEGFTTSYDNGTLNIIDGEFEVIENKWSKCSKTMPSIIASAEGAYADYFRGILSFVDGEYTTWDDADCGCRSSVILTDADGAFADYDSGNLIVVKGDFTSSFARVERSCCQPKGGLKQLKQMFDNYDDKIVTCIPYNRENKKIKKPKPKPMMAHSTPHITTDVLNKEVIYNCYLGEQIGFSICGHIFNEDGKEVNLKEYLADKTVKLSLFNLWGELVASKTAYANTKVLVTAPNLYSGVYRGILELVDANNVVLTRLFDMHNGIFKLSSYIENTNTTDIHVNTLPIEVVSSLPEVGVVGVLYLIPSGSANDAYNEYLYVNNTWNKLGGLVYYSEIEGKPTINGEVVEGDKIATQYDLEYDMDEITNADIDLIIGKR